jgi:NAD(P)-dependent dehydrogenase (short-subunit alcohol dehydrogenase family)
VWLLDSTNRRHTGRTTVGTTNGCGTKPDAAGRRWQRLHTRHNLPIRRVVGPADIAAVAVHLMTNTAVTGATFDIDGGQQLIER